MTKEKWMEIISIKNPPQKITKEWLEEMRKNAQEWELFNLWGFCSADLSKCDFSGLSLTDLSNIYFDSSTIWPSKDKLPKGFNPKAVIERGKSPLLNYKQLHENGITGKGVKIAVIDSGFRDVNHKEFDGRDVSIVPLGDEEILHFHAECVLANLCGKNIGVAPEASVVLFPHYTGGKRHIPSLIIAMEEVLKKLNAGENFKILSASMQLIYHPEYYQNRMSKEEFDKINYLIKQIEDKGCKVIDSTTSWRDFVTGGFSIQDDFSNLDNVNYETFWFENEDERNSFGGACIIGAGKCVPEYYSDTGYKYCPRASGSWCIPQISGTYALCLQVKPNLSYETFAELCKKTVDVNKHGVRILNPVRLIEGVKKLK